MKGFAPGSSIFPVAVVNILSDKLDISVQCLMTINKQLLIVNNSDKYIIYNDLYDYNFSIYYIKRK